MREVLDLTILLLCCCCVPLLLIFMLIVSIFEISSFSRTNKDVPSIISRIWYRTILLTPRGIAAIIFSIFSIWLATTSIDASTLSTIGIFFLVILFAVWVVGQLLNIYLFLRAQSSGGLIRSKINYHLLQESDAIKQTLELDLPKPWGFILKIRVVVPPKLGKDLRVTGLKENQIQLIPEYSKRGEYELGPILVEFTDMFGLTSIILQYLEKEKLRIIPKIKSISKLDWSAPTAKIGDDYSVKKVINTDELYDIKKYVRGDDVRRIHWKLSARTSELMMRKPELSFVTVGEFLVVLDNQIPQRSGLGDFTNVVGTDKLLDRMVNTAGSILDYAAKHKTNTKLFYYDDKGKLVKINPLNTRRDKWLIQLSKIKWVRSRTNSFRVNLPEDKLSEIGFFVLTSEVNASRFETIKKTLKVQGANVVYFPADTYVEFQESKKGKGWKKRIARLVLAKDAYSEQVQLGDNIKRLFFKKPTVPTDMRKQALAKQVANMKSFLSSNFPDYKIIAEQDDYVSILEGMGGLERRK